MFRRPADSGLFFDGAAPRPLCCVSLRISSVALPSPLPPSRSLSLPRSPLSCRAALSRPVKAHIYSDALRTPDSFSTASPPPFLLR